MLTSLIPTPAPLGLQQQVQLVFEPVARHGAQPAQQASRVPAQPCLGVGDVGASGEREHLACHGVAEAAAGGHLTGEVPHPQHHGMGILLDLVGHGQDVLDAVLPVAVRTHDRLSRVVLGDMREAGLQSHPLTPVVRQGDDLAATRLGGGEHVPIVGSRAVVHQDDLGIGARDLNRVQQIQQLAIGLIGGNQHDHCRLTSRCRGCRWWRVPRRVPVGC